MKLKIKYCLSLFVLICQLSYAQKDEEKIKGYMWNPADADFKITKCDPKWKKESAVILYRTYEYKVRKEIVFSNIDENTYSHTRILLNDKAAVEKFSTFTIDVSKHTGYYFGFGANCKIYCGVKIVKPNNTETEIPIDKKLIDEIKFKNGKAQIQKIAVPNLQVGDILDYYLVCESKINGDYLFYTFQPALYYLSDNYPIQKQKMQMFIMRKCYLSAHSMNGAPELKSEKVGETDDIVWTITDTNRDKMQDQQFLYSNREAPILAFQALYVRRNMFDNQLYFIDKEDKIKSSISDENYQKFFEYMQSNDTYKIITKNIKNIFNKKFKKEKDISIIAHEGYNIIRENNFSSDLRFNLGRDYISNPYSDFDFVLLFSSYLKKYKIDHTIIVTTPKEIGSLSDIVMRAQMGYIIRVNTPTPIYFSTPSAYTLYSEYDYSYQGCKGKYAEFAKKPKLTIKETTVPVSSYKNNVSSQTMNVSFDTEDAEKIKIQQEIKATGQQKSMYQSSFISIGERLKEVEKNRYNLKLWKISSKKMEARVQEILKNDDTDRETRITDYLKEEFAVENIKNTRCELVQAGMWDEKPEFIFKHDFEISHFITKTGDNILLEIGKLIGTQLSPDKNDSVRLYNIYISYPRTLEYTINVAIPQNYKVKGIEKLNTNITNETGGFTCSASIDGDKIILKIKKYYSNNYFTKDKWPLMVSFLTAAVDFRNQKIMFVPKK